MQGYLKVYKSDVRGKLEQNGITAFYDRITGDFLEKFGWYIPNVTDRIVQVPGGKKGGKKRPAKGK